MGRYSQQQGCKNSWTCRPQLCGRRLRRHGTEISGNAGKPPCSSDGLRQRRTRRTSLDLLLIERDQMNCCRKQQTMYTSCVCERHGRLIVQDKELWAAADMDPEEFRGCIGRTVGLIIGNISRSNRMHSRTVDLIIINISRGIITL